jgi:hypothetical protein
LEEWYYEQKIPTSNVVTRTVEFEKERFARIEDAKTLPGARLPEIDVVDPRPSREESEPATVCDTDKGFHGFPAKFRLAILGTKVPF